MNFSRNVNLLKTIDDTLDDKIYVGVTESKGVLEAIDGNLEIIDGVLDSIKIDTNAANSHLSNIHTSVSNQTSSLDAIEASSENVDLKLVDIGITLAANDANLSSIVTSTANADTSLNAVEADINLINNKLVDIGVTLAKSNAYNMTQKYKPLLYNGTDRLLTLADYSSSPAWMYFQNDEGANVIVKKISFTFHSSETNWDDIFTSTTDGNLWFGQGNTNSAIGQGSLFFDNNTECQPFMSMVFSDPAGGDGMYYSYVVDGLNFKLNDGKYFNCRLTGNFSAAGDQDFSAAITYNLATPSAEL